MMKVKNVLFLLLQIALLVICGLISGDAAYSVVLSVIGISFNYLVSVGVPFGFLVGLIYALLNGFYAYRTGVYATFAFMVFLQAPMAIVSFVQWKKKSAGGNAVLKKMSKKGICILILLMLLLFVLLLLVLNAVGSRAVLVDSVFFVFSVSACLLLAFMYKNAYIVTLLSGLGGTALWLYQMLTVKSGLSLAVFYLIVAVNSVTAIKREYLKKERDFNDKERKRRKED